MTYRLKMFFATLVIFFAIDMVWLGLVANSFYRTHLGFIMSPSPNWPAAIIFYLLFIIGLLVFVILPGLQAGSLRVLLLKAALFGLVTYATYDLTNLATLKDWPLIVTVVDLTWGVVLSTLVSAAAFFVGQRLA